MVNQNFIRSDYDHYVYFNSFIDIFTILVLYVDDMIITSKNMEEINMLNTQLSMTFNMKDLGRYTQIGKMESFGYHNRNMWK